MSWNEYLEMLDISSISTRCLDQTFYASTAQAERQGGTCDVVPFNATRALHNMVQNYEVQAQRGLNWHWINTFYPQTDRSCVDHFESVERFRKP